MSRLSQSSQKISKVIFPSAARFAIKIEVGPWLPRETHFAFSSSTGRAYFKEGYSNNMAMMVKVLVDSE